MTEELHSLYVIAVVGTSGKSTTTWLTRHLLKTAGIRAGVMSSVGNLYAGDERYSIPEHLRHADAPYLEYSLAELLRDGCTHAVIECSANEARLAQLAYVNYETAVWTTLHADDMDFSGSVQANFAAKWRVVAGARCAVVNLGDEWATRQIHAPGYTQRHITYGDDARADWRADEVVERALGSEFTVRAPGKTFRTFLPMIGRYNIVHALGAMAAAARAGVPARALAKNLPTFRGVPARMQVVAAQPVRVIVDFGNTSSRLQGVLHALRPTTENRLIVVTGSHDEPRYAADRAALGAAAARGADYAILTEAGYRENAPEVILEQLVRGALDAGQTNFETVLDRRAAIQRALDVARPRDTVLIAGKGTETTIERGNTSEPWDEVQIVKGLGVYT